MLKQPTIEKLAAMRLLGMAEALKAQEQDPSARELSFLERFGLLVDQQWNWRENQALSRRLKNAKLRTANACVEEIHYRTARGIDKSVIRSLTQQSAWVGTHENIFVLGPCDPETFCTSSLHHWNHWMFTAGFWADGQPSLPLRFLQTSAALPSQTSPLRGCPV